MKASTKYAPSEYMLEESKSVEWTNPQASSASPELPLWGVGDRAHKGKAQNSSGLLL